MSMNPLPLSIMSAPVEMKITKSHHYVEYPKANPNFIVIGGQKCATTWLFKQLAQHPQIYIPDCKEVNFFNKEYNFRKGIEWYREQFAGYGGEKAVGECTPNYLWTTMNPSDLKESDRTKNIPRLVHTYYPNVKLIAILRDPVDRAISAFYHHIRSRDIAPGSRILDVCKHRGILSMGFYDNDLCNWFQYFSKNQFLILFFEDIVNYPLNVINQVYKFLDVDDKFISSDVCSHFNVRYGATYLYIHYYSPFIAKSLRWVFPNFIHFNWPEIKITDSDVEHLKEIYASHIQRLEYLLHKPTPWGYH